MQKPCRQCSAPFEVTKEDLALLEKVAPAVHGKTFSIPPPEKCPPCRRRQRLVFRNFFNLHHRTCDLTGKKIIAMYDDTVPFPVYDQAEWWSEKWDGLAHGKDPDFQKPLLPQIGELHRTVPRMNLNNVLCENSDYCNLSVESRDCYLVFGNISNENCAYGHIVWQSHDCYDCLYVYRSAFCYECIDCVQCHALAFSRDCDNCSDSMFLVHCVGCRNCFGCVGLKNKEYHIFNVPHSKEDYSRKIRELNTGNVRIVQAAREKLRELIGKEIVKYYHGFNCENVTGDYLYNCKNIVEGYDMKNCEDCRYCATMESFKDSGDCNFSGGTQGAELCYNSLTVGGGYHILFSHNCQNSCADLLYCDHCYACKHCFGCMGLKNKTFCILNKQYSKEQYEELLPKLITRMQTNKEWGEFFPATFSLFPYNHTIAFEYFPQTKAETEKKGGTWKDDDPKTQKYMGPELQLPDDITDADEKICNSILRCEATGKLYKIIPQELAFLKQFHLPLPRKCFEQRQRERFALRNPRKLWKRNCAKCSKEIQTTYSPERPEIVYCENCYLETVY